MTKNEAIQKAARLEKDIEQLRVQLAGCGVAAMQNTERTIKARAKEGDYGYSASYSDVCKAVDREMRYREALKDIAVAGESGSNFPQDGRMYDIAKAALEI
jgi:hypothetical protein